MFKDEPEYLDDRMYVLTLSNGTVRPLSGPRALDEPRKAWILVTRRNVQEFAPTRSDDFGSREEALYYAKKVIPLCPRVSLDGKAPQPTPTWDQHIAWLKETGINDPMAVIIQNSINNGNT